jgi:hypothetical protein
MKIFHADNYVLSLPRFVTSRAIQLRNRAFCFSNVKNS